MSNNINDLTVGAVEAKSTGKLANSANNSLYIVMMTDPSMSANCRYFFTNKVDKPGYGVEFRGYEIVDNAQKLVNLKTFADAINLAIMEKREIIDIVIPWQYVICIRNASYKIKSA